MVKQDVAGFMNVSQLLLHYFLDHDYAIEDSLQEAFWAHVWSSGQVGHTEWEKIPQIPYGSVTAAASGLRCTERDGARVGSCGALVLNPLHRTRHSDAVRAVVGGDLLLIKSALLHAYMLPSSILMS